MNTPICDFVRQYAEEKNLRLHMPGHKGKGPLGLEILDITEIDGADVLYHCDGIIKESQDNAAKLFGSAKTVYSAEGSSLAIRAMLYLAVLHAKERGKLPRIAAGRNAHKTFMTAAALLDLEVQWLYPENRESILSCHITAEELEKHLSAEGGKTTAVYITSPDYLGNRADISALAAVCHKHGALLQVDNAHGAYLNFLPQSLHPMALGADLCCDSAHKTLPVLTGGAYLHIGKGAPDLLSQQAERAMSLFASTSPSYLILQSLDAANRYLAEDYREKLAAFASKVSDLKKRLKSQGFALVGEEALKLSLAPKSYGYRGTELADCLRGKGIVCEFSDPDYLVLMLTPEIGEDGLAQIEAALSELPKKEAVSEMPPLLPIPQKELSLRTALFSPSAELEISRCEGKILADANVACPPAIPILVSGEVIDPAAIDCLSYYGISHCRVVSQ